MRTATLLPDADALHLEELVADADAITVVVTTRGTTARCPDCGETSARLHSRKRRRLADLPWQGLAVCLDLQLRRFYCHTPTCARRTFTERVPTVVAPHARRTARLATLKAEGAAARPWPTRAAARTAVFEWLEVWYNRQRAHSALDYLPPVTFEENVLLLSESRRLALHCLRKRDNLNQTVRRDDERVKLHVGLRWWRGVKRHQPTEAHLIPQGHKTRTSG